MENSSPEWLNLLGARHRNHGQKTLREYISPLISEEPLDQVFICTSSLYGKEIQIIKISIVTDISENICYALYASAIIECLFLFKINIGVFF